MSHRNEARHGAAPAVIHCIAVVAKNLGHSLVHSKGRGTVSENKNGQTVTHTCGVWISDLCRRFLEIALLRHRLLEGRFENSLVMLQQQTFVLRVL